MKQIYLDIFLDTFACVPGNTYGARSTSDPAERKPTKPVRIFSRGDTDVLDTVYMTHQTLESNAAARPTWGMFPSLVPLFFHGFAFLFFRFGAPLQVYMADGSHIPTPALPQATAEPDVPCGPSNSN
jgi:hypothetical protein